MRDETTKSLLKYIEQAPTLAELEEEKTKEFYIEQYLISMVIRILDLNIIGRREFRFESNSSMDISLVLSAAMEVAKLFRISGWDIEIDDKLQSNGTLTFSWACYHFPICEDE